MQIIVPHDKGQQEAIRRIDQAAEQALRASYPGISITDPQKHWKDSTMNLSARIGAGFMNILVAVEAQARDSEVAVDFDLPPLVKQFLPEAKIRSEVETRLREILEA